MPPPTTKRPAQSSISTFGRISKATNVQRIVKTESCEASKTPAKTSLNSLQSTAVSAKRKRDDDESECSEDSKQLTRPAKQCRTTEFDSTSVPQCQTPKKARANPQDLPTPGSTPTKLTSPRALKKTPTRGQQRLSDIKGLVANAQKAEITAKTAHLPDSHGNRKVSTLQSRTTSLYDRLKAKSTQRANAPSPPTAEEVSRRNALQRLPDVVRVLAMPPAKNTQARGSHSLRSLVDRVQQSARSPMSPQEIEDCLRLLMREEKELGADGFVRFCRVGNMETVTLDARRRPMELEERVAASLRRGR